MSKCKVKIEGDTGLTIIKRLTDAKINLYSPSVVKNGVYVAIKTENLSRLIAIAEELCYNINIVRWYGLGRLVRFAASNVIITMAAVFALILLALSNFFVFDINVEAYSVQAEETALNVLNSYGIGVFTKKSDIRLDELENAIVCAVLDAEYVYASIFGSQLNIRMTQESIGEVSPDYYQTADIVADRTGVVESVVTLRGTAAVKVGDVVKKGQLLISSKVEYADGSSKLVRATGIVRARVSCSAQTVFNGSVLVIEETGRTMEYTRLRIFNARVQQKIPDFATYREVIQTYLLLPFPMFIDKVVAYETVSVIREFDFESVKVGIFAELYAKALEKADFQVVSREDTFDGQFVTVTLYGFADIGESVYR
ncbi:MAG: sporulation protein YqfD [Clostridia bacterium]|nr:sporulation protein YqfD [Clostridia bacterium]